MNHHFLQAARSNKRFERDAPTVGFAACFRAPQAEHTRHQCEALISNISVFN